MSHTVRPHAIRHDLETFYGQYLEKSVVREGSFEHSYKGFKLLKIIFLREQSDTRWFTLF